VGSPLRSVVAFDLFASGDSEGQPGTTIDSKGLVGLFEHKAETRERCFGVIGSSSRACTKFTDECGIGTHKVKKGNCGRFDLHMLSLEGTLYLLDSVNQCVR
jgi:hypothetical protein